jgi:hypothetical protein
VGQVISHFERMSSNVLPLTPAPPFATHQALLVAALQRFAYSYRACHNSIPVQPRVIHECSSGCSLFQYEDVFICKQSGNFHICTSETCPHLVVPCEKAQGRTCTLTGVVYHLDEFVLGKDTDCYDFCRLTPLTKAQFVTPSPSPSPSPSPPLPLLLPPPPDHHPAKRSVHQRKLLPRKIVKDEALKQRADAHNVQVEIFGTDWEHIDFVTTLCLDLWQKISTTSQFLVDKNRYTFRYHVLVILLHMTSGFVTTHKRVPLIPSFEPVRKRVHLLEMKRLRKEKNWVPRRYTNTGKIFRACVQELYS